MDNVHTTWTLAVLALFGLQAKWQDGVLQDQPQSDFPAPLPDYSEEGVDLSLIRWMLSLTPAERLQFLDDHIQAIETIRQLNAPHGLTAITRLGSLDYSAK